LTWFETPSKFVLCHGTCWNIWTRSRVAGVSFGRNSDRLEHIESSRFLVEPGVIEPAKWWTQVHIHFCEGWSASADETASAVVWSLLRRRRCNIDVCRCGILPGSLTSQMRDFCSQMRDRRYENRSANAKMLDKMLKNRELDIFTHFWVLSLEFGRFQRGFSRLRLG